MLAVTCRILVSVNVQSGDMEDRRENKNLSNNPKDTGRGLHNGTNLKNLN